MQFQVLVRVQGDAPVHAPFEKGVGLLGLDKVEWPYPVNPTRVVVALLAVSMMAFLLLLLLQKWVHPYLGLGLHKKEV